ncbi:hypothetical protein HanIR_Chr02g0083201 [Helianthus annuus]|nr:hypothetical protein HanIR_Chr02g0083201 [Helianthus annuus]
MPWKGKWEIQLLVAGGGMLVLACMWRCLTRVSSHLLTWADLRRPVPGPWC